MPPVSVLIKPASGLCNMTCDYCFYCDEAEKRTIPNFGFMEERTLKNVIRRTMVRAEGEAAYAYQGGEPTLRGIGFFEKAMEYQRQYNRNQVRVTNALQTNGYALDGEWCRFLKENDFLVGLSVDGTKEIHDAHRRGRDGGVTYERAVRAARLMEQHGVVYNILTVVTADTASHVEEIYENYKRNGWDFQQYIPCLDPLGDGHEQTFFSISARQYGAFLAELFALWHRDLKNGCEPYIRTFANFIDLAGGYQAEACNQRGCCSVQYAVEADGSVYPCDFFMLDAYRLGNFNTDRLETIDKRREEIGFLSASRRISPDCLSCSHYRLCRGGCMRSRDLNQQTGWYSSFFCEGYRLFFDRWADTIREIAGELGGV